MELVVPYEPRDAFLEFHLRNTRFAAMCCHRRAGKTVACIGDLVTRALYSKKPKPCYAYLGPFRGQAKKIAWQYLKDMTTNVRVGPPRESDLQVTLLNGATITIYGADNPDSIRGLFFDGMVIDEYKDCRPSLWGDVLLPTLLDRRGWAVFIGTMGGKNHFFQMLERARKEAGWFHKILKASESALLSPEDLQIARAEMTEEQYAREMECDSNAAVQGTYYSKIVGEMEVAEKIGHYPFDPTEMVHCSADLGFSDSTAFWFWQLTAEGPRMIDYEEHDGEKLQFYIDMLNEKPYEYADLWLPHDAKAHTLQTGRSTVEQLLDPKGDGSFEGGFPCKVVPKLAVQHGIDAARLILPQITIHKETCYSGIEALRGYRRQWNDKTQQFANTPLHDWASNGSDSFRYFALVTETKKSTVDLQKDIIPILTTPEYCLEDLYDARKDDDWRRSIIRI